MKNPVLLLLFLAVGRLAQADPAPDPKPPVRLNRATGHLDLIAGSQLLSDPAIGGTLATERLPATASRSLLAKSSNAVDSRLAGLTARDATVKLFSTQDDSGAAGTYVRSATCWVHDLNLTCVSVYSTGGGTSHWETGTAISPRHVLLANHFNPGVGNTLRFVGATGTVITRTITAALQVGSTDILIGKLDSDLPATITPAKVLPANYVGASTLIGAPVIHTNRYQQVSVKVLTSLASKGLTLADPPTSDVERRAFDIPIQVGDSSHPIFVVVGSQPVLLGDFHYSNGGDNLVGNVAGINAAMRALGGGYQLSPASLPGVALTNAATQLASLNPNFTAPPAGQPTGTAAATP